MLKTFLLAVLASMITCGAARAQVVATTTGEVSGVSSGGVSTWKGIAYAAPPVGDLRWMPPQPAKAWSGIRQAAVAGPACPQPDFNDGLGAGSPQEQDEDCLTLNVFAPEGARNLPVMVWIHGGAFRIGYASSPLYDGTEFARQGVVLVTLNYRLGLLGFFAHPAVTAAAKSRDAIGNYGLMDQIAALKWVRDNIAAFGGNPANVTVFGESAGGSSIIHLLTNPGVKGLFAKAIVESGGGLQRSLDLRTSEANGVQAASRLGLGAKATLAELKARPASDWVKAQGPLQGLEGLAFGPFIDGRFVAEAPVNAFRGGRALDVPLLIGANSNEASVLTALGVPATALATAVGPRLAELQALYGEGTATTEFNRQAMGDIAFVAPARWIAAQTSAGQPSYLYHFSYVAALRRNAQPGATHGSELPYLFKVWTRIPILARVMSDADKQMSSMLNECWVTFAKTGAPACSPAPAWPAYDPKSDLQMHFGTTTQVEKPTRPAALDFITTLTTGP